MKPTLSAQAHRARIYANGAAARKRKSSALRREAIRLTALSMLNESRKQGHHFSRSIDKALRG